MRTAEIGGLQWWAGTREFENAQVAALRFQDLNEYGQRLRGSLHVGVYRHKPDDGTSTASYITIVGHHRDGVERALRRVGGEVVEIHPELLTRLVYRRARVVNAMEGAAPGAYRFPHGEKGIVIDAAGNAEER